MTTLDRLGGLPAWAMHKMSEEHGYLKIASPARK